MASDAIRFIRKDGHIIPIRAPSGTGGARVAGKAAKGLTHAGRALSVGASAHGIHKAAKSYVKNKGPSTIKTNKKLDAVGLGASVASGAIAAATFSLGAKGLLGGTIASHALDAVGVGANLASVAGKGKTKERAKVAAKNEARNFLIGNAVFVGGLVGLKKNRAAAASYAKKGAAYAQKIVAFGRKALGAI